MVFLDLILKNYVTISLIAGLFLSLGIQKMDRFNTKFFLLALICLSLLIVSDVVDTYCISRKELNIIRTNAASLGYVLRPTVILLITKIFLRDRRSSNYLYIPLVISAVLIFTSNFTHLVFWFSDNGSFNRGPLGFLAHFLSGFYALILIFHTIKSSSFISRTEIWVISFIVIICTVATAIETLKGNKFLLSGALAVSVAIYFVYFNVQSSRYDIATEVFNRKSFFEDSSKLLNQTFTIISIDLDGLKYINDNFGHFEGDKALKALAHTLVTFANKKFRIYRLGGDEFMGLGLKVNEDEVRKFTEDVMFNLKMNGYFASIGWEVYHPGDCFDQVYHDADMKMYSIKTKHKSERL